MPHRPCGRGHAQAPTLRSSHRGRDPARGTGCDDVVDPSSRKAPRASWRSSFSKIVGARRVAKHEQHAHVPLPVDEPCGAAALLRSGWRRTSVLGGPASSPAGLWLVGDLRRVFYTIGEAICTALRSTCFAAVAKSGLFSITRRGTSPGSRPGPGPERPERLVRLSGWTPQRNFCRGSEQRTRPTTSARSARSSRWSTTCSRSGRGCSCATRPSGRDPLESSRWPGARRFPSGRKRSGQGQARSGEVAGERRFCSRVSCSLQAQLPAGSSVERTRRRRRCRSRLRSRCGR